MKNLSIRESEAFSLISIEEDRKEETYPKKLSFDNPTVANITLSAPGVIEIESLKGEDETMVIGGGIHGDEKAGVVIIDELMKEIVDGSLEVNQNLLLTYGNLQAMDANEGKGVRCVEPETGITANLNRCFNQGVFANPKNYAEFRANQITESVERLVKGCVTGIDIHQSYDVPTVGEVRNIIDDSQYTFGMLFPTESLEKTVNWIRAKFSDIVAGTVITSHMDKPQKTFGGYLAQGMKGDAVTLEQGTIGDVGKDTFTPQLLENLKRKIRGEDEIQNPQNFDLWEASQIIYKTPSLHFMDSNGLRTESLPRDFMPTNPGLIAKDDEVEYRVKEGERLLFAGLHMPNGDHAGEIIKQRKV